MDKPVVIVGSGLAGYGLARELRKLDPVVPIVVLTADGGEQYAKPNLSVALAAGHDAEKLVQASAQDAADKLRIAVRTHSVVTAIDTAAQTVTVDGEELAYRDLVLAVGADPMRPPFLTDAVLQDGRVRQVNDLDGYRAWRKQLEGAQRIVVIGAGLIGLEFACDLRAVGLDVTVVDMAPQPLGRLLPPEAAEVMRQKLSDAGVQWRLGQGIAAVQPQEAGVDVVLADGEVLQGDRVLVAIGLAPRLDLARQAGLETARAIAVDAYGQASAPHVYALGDCAQVAGQWLPFVAPILHAARAMAQTINGTPTAIAYPAMPVVVKTPQWPTVVLPAPQDAVWTTEQVDGGVRAMAHNAESSLVGFVLMGSAVAERLALTRLVGTKHGHA